MPIQEINDDIVRIAREMGALGELCNLIDYDPRIGRVPEHFEPKWEVAELVRRLLAERRTATQPTGEPAAAGSATSFSSVAERSK